MQTKSQQKAILQKAIAHNDLANLCWHVSAWKGGKESTPTFYGKIPVVPLIVSQVIIIQDGVPHSCNLNNLEQAELSRLIVELMLAEMKVVMGTSSELVLNLFSYADIEKAGFQWVEWHSWDDEPATCYVCPDCGMVGDHVSCRKVPKRKRKCTGS